MVKQIVQAQLKLGTEKLAKFEAKLAILKQDKNDSYSIQLIEREKEYWRGVKNTAEIILGEILEEEKYLKEAQ